MNRVLNGILSIVLAVVFVAVGIFLLVMGVGRLQAMNAGRFQETQATITRIDTRTETDPDGPDRTVYDIMVEYEADGKKVVAQLDQNPRDFYEGMELTVQYNMDKPTEVTLPGKSSAYFSMGFGIVAILCGAFLVLQKLRGR